MAWLLWTAAVLALFGAGAAAVAVRWVVSPPWTRPLRPRRDFPRRLARWLGRG